MNDFRLIVVPYRVEHPAAERPQRLERRRTRHLTAEDTLAMHWQQRSWLRRTLASSFDGPTVVITHHAPGWGSVAPRYLDDALTPALVSELPGEFFDAPDALVLWIHGQTHNSADFQQGRCRVVANPRGYLMRNGGFENENFDPSL